MAKESRIKKNTRILIIAIQQEIDRNPIKNKKVASLVLGAGIDRKLLEAGFKQIFNVTIKKYQIMRRMEFSRQLLDEGRLSIKEIAYQCGYSSQNSFAKAFKKLYSQTPTDWQNRPEGIEEEL
jgi:AraC-like DNA-binding protein